MKNSSESSHESYEIKFFEFCSSVNAQSAYQRPIYLFIISTSIVIVHLIYLSLPQIGLLTGQFLVLNPFVGLGFMLFNMLIAIQILIGVLKNMSLILKIQVFAYMNIIFILSCLSLLHQISVEKYISAPVCIVIICICAIMNLQIGVIFCQESYQRILIQKDSLPLPLELIGFYLLLCLYSSNQSIRSSLLLMMAIFSVITRFSTFGSSIRKCRLFEYYLYRLSASLNCLYTVILIFLNIFGTVQKSIGFTELIVAIIFISMYELLDYYIDHMPSVPSQFFSNEHLPKLEEIIVYCQYVTSDIFYLLQSPNKVQFSKTCLGPFFYEHIKQCRSTDCNLSHQFVNFYQLKNISEFIYIRSHKNTPYRVLSHKVCKIMEQKFMVLMTEYPENIEIKMALIRFYSITRYNKFKIVKLITQVEVLLPTLRQKIELYHIKHIISELEVVQALDNIKVDDTLMRFCKTLSIIVNLIIDLWSLVLEEKVDFSKVVKKSEKMFPLIQSLESQVSDALAMETYSTIKIMKIYSQYNKLIMNDNRKTIIISDYIQLLNKKFIEMNELNYISSDCEKALIAISLSEKKLGIIKMVNTHAGIIFGYEKQEMQKMNINTFMPKSFSVNHNSFLQNFIHHPNKKLNTDMRDSYAKNRQGYIFSIKLQLKKTVLTVTDDLMFVASIELAHTQNTPILIACNEEGAITDYSSSFQYIFIKSIKKNTESNYTITNIQQIIPDFYSLYEAQENEGRQFTEVFDNPVYGITEIKFTIQKLSFPKQRDAGYMIKGYREKQSAEKIFFPSTNITKSLLELNSKKQLKGNALIYNSKKNEYLLSNCSQYFHSLQLSSYFTIPFIKLEDITGALFGKPNEAGAHDYETDIKTIRLCQDHFQRVEQVQSFVTESETEHYHLQNNKKLEELKEQFSTTTDKFKYLKKFVVINHIVTLVGMGFIIAMIFINLHISSVNIRHLSRIESSNIFRALLAELVVYMQIEQKLQMSVDMTNHKRQTINELIQMNLQANIPQKQKENALKIIDLKQNENLEQFLKDETFDIPVIIPQSSGVLLGFRIIFYLLILFKIIVNSCLIIRYRARLKQIYNFFLSLPESQIRNSITNSQNVLKLIRRDDSFKNEEIGSSPEKENDEEEQHIKIRKFKNVYLNNQKFYYFKIIVTSVIIMLAFAIGNTYLGILEYHLNRVKSNYQFMSAIIPETSVYLMKGFLLENKGKDFGITDNFFNITQEIQLQTLIFSQDNGEISQSYFNWLFQNPCGKYIHDENCEILLDGVLKGGVSKGLNYLMNRFSTIINTPDNEQQMLKFSQLLYQNIKYIFNEVNEVYEYHIEDEFIKKQRNSLIIFIVILALSLVDYLYLQYGGYMELSNKLESANSLLKIIPGDQRNIKKKEKNGYEQLQSLS